MRCGSCREETNKSAASIALDTSEKLPCGATSLEFVNESLVIGVSSSGLEEMNWV